MARIAMALSALFTGFSQGNAAITTTPLRGCPKSPHENPRSAAVARRRPFLELDAGRHTTSTAPEMDPINARPRLPTWHSRLNDRHDHDGIETDLRIHALSSQSVSLQRRFSSDDGTRTGSDHPTTTRTHVTRHHRPLCQPPRTCGPDLTHATTRLDPGEHVGSHRELCTHRCCEFRGPLLRAAGEWTRLRS
jgi:hypothetical protein